MPFDVGQLETLVVKIRFGQVIYDLCGTKRLQPFFGEVGFVDERIEYGQEEMAVQAFLLADRSDAFVSCPQIDSEPIDDEYQCRFVQDRIAQFGFG